MNTKLKYPTETEINNADRIQIARWYRYLPSPGVAYIGDESFIDHCHNEARLMDRINSRFEQLGGMTSELSKTIAWR